MICITPKRESRTDGLSRDQRYTRAGNANASAEEQRNGRRREGDASVAQRAFNIL